VVDAAVRGRVVAWHLQNKRQLPCRETRDPYAILVSEVVLQQTQVSRVIEVWTAWLE
jgi:A/G-specific adenine glycosylase